MDNIEIIVDPIQKVLVDNKPTKNWASAEY